MSSFGPRDWIFAAICHHSADLPELDDTTSRDAKANPGDGARTVHSALPDRSLPPSDKRKPHRQARRASA
jgi:hypothetical protein